MNTSANAKARMVLSSLIGLGVFVLLFSKIASVSNIELQEVIILVVIVAIIIRVVSRKRAVAGPPSKSVDHGSAEWATHSEIDSILKGTAPPLWIGDGYERRKQGHLITIAGSGQGKGTCVIIPNLLSNLGSSVVITDPKGENACITARAQKQFGQRVFILDPWDEQKSIGAKHNIPASGFNPFDFLKMQMDELRDNCEQIASFLVPEKPGEKDPYWNDRARTMIKTFLMHIITDRSVEEHNFWTLYKMLRLSGKPWLELLLDMKENESTDGLVSIAAGEFLGMDEAGSTLTGIRSSAQNATTIFESPQLKRSLEKTDFNPYDLTDGNCTVYIVIPERFIETHATWLRLVIGLCLKACNAKPNKRVIFMLDEFAVMGKMKDVQKGYAFARGQNIILWFFAQSLSQIKEIYGEDGMNTFLSNTALVQYFGIKDQYTKDYVSKALGEATYTKKSNSYGTSTGKDGGSSNSSTSYQTFGRPLMTAEEVEKSPYIITMSEGLKFRITKAPYYSNRYEGLDLRKENYLPKHIIQTMKEGGIPKDWREHFQDLADPPPRLYA